MRQPETRSFFGGRATLIHGDSREIVPTLGASETHAIVTDPPYGLRPDGTCRTWDDLAGGGRGFKGLKWDAARAAAWAEAAAEAVAEAADRMIDAMLGAMERAGMHADEHSARVERAS